MKSAEELIDIEKVAAAIEADAGELLAALRAERLQRKGYEAELEAAVKACQ